MIKYRLAVALAAAAFAAPAVAQQHDPVAVQNAWARATAPGIHTAAVYLTLTSPSADTLVGISTPAASTAAVHRTIMDGTIMRMRPLAGGLALPAGQPVTLKPGGDHIMLEGLKAPLKRGETVTLHLTFASAPPLDVQAKVEGPGASGPGMPGMSSMPGMKMD
jgi:copper(I)-binding protein